MKPKESYLKKVYEWANFSENATIIDLGAWKGITSHYFSLKVPKGKVIAVEPSKETMAICMERCKDRDNIIFCPYAISDKIGEAEINIYNKSEANSLFLKSPERYKMRRKEVVETFTWDKLMEFYQIEKVDFCKVNIEGAETLLLKGMTKVFPEKMIIEQHYRLGIINKKELFGLIRQRGYKIVEEYKCDFYCEHERKI